MSSYTKTEFEKICREICPRCAESWPIDKRSTGEYTHTRISTNATGANNFASTICMATHFRVTYEGKLSDD